MSLAIAKGDMFKVIGNTNPKHHARVGGTVMFSGEGGKGHSSLFMVNDFADRDVEIGFSCIQLISMDDLEMVSHG